MLRCIFSSRFFGGRDIPLATLIKQLFTYSLKEKVGACSEHRARFSSQLLSQKEGPCKNVIYIPRVKTNRVQGDWYHYVRTFVKLRYRSGRYAQTFDSLDVLASFPSVPNSKDTRHLVPTPLFLGPYIAPIHPFFPLNAQETWLENGISKMK